MSPGGDFYLYQAGDTRWIKKKEPTHVMTKEKLSE